MTDSGSFIKFFEFEFHLGLNYFGSTLKLQLKIKPKSLEISVGHSSEIVAASVCAELGMIASSAKEGPVLVHTITGELLRRLEPPVADLRFFDRLKVSKFSKSFQKFFIFFFETSYFEFKKVIESNY